MYYRSMYMENFNYHFLEANNFSMVIRLHYEKISPRIINLNLII